MLDLHDILEDDETLDFVLKGDDEQYEPESLTSPDDLAATMRGDLSHVNLPDIFQTVTMSRMQGTLQVEAGYDKVHVHFGDGRLRVLSSDDVRMRRLGNRLVTSGLLEARDVRTCFIQYRKEGGNLGDILAATGKMEKIQLDALRMGLEEDLLLELLTLRHGSFAFFRDSYPEPGLEERFRSCVEFVADNLLLEIARRSDEWAVIMPVLGDLDEILVRTRDLLPQEIGDVARDVWELINGEHSLRDIAGGMLDSLFEVAKGAASLVNAGCVEKASAAHLIELARSALTREHQRQAHRVLSLLRDHREATVDELQEAAELFVVTGDTKTAAEMLGSTARTLHGRDRQLLLLRRAQELDRLNKNVLKLLVEALYDPGLAEQSEEYHDSANRLIEAYSDTDDFGPALALLDRLIADRPGNLILMARRARILLKLGRGGEAVEDLASLATTFRESGDLASLASTLEQIVKIEPGNSAARSELRALSESPATRWLRLGVIALGAATVGTVAWLVLSTYFARQALDRELSDVQQLINVGQLDEADRRLRELDAQSPGGSRVKELVDAIVSRRAAAEQQRRDQEVKQLLSRIDDAVKRLNSGDHVGALGSYASLLSEHAKELDHRRRIRESMQARFQGLADTLRDDIAWLEKSRESLASTPSTPEGRRAQLVEMQKHFPDHFLAAVEKLQSALDEHPAWKEMEGLPPRLVESIASYLKLGREVPAKRISLAEAIARDANRMELDPTFVAAEEAWHRFDFQAAWEAYSILARDFTGDEAMRREFESKRDLCKKIRDTLAELEAATEAGDYKRATMSYEVLRKLRPDAPFDGLVELPFHIATRPAGADILNGTTKVGTTPLLYRYRPNAQPALTLKHSGFKPVTVPLESLLDGSFEIVLEMEPKWAQRLAGAMTQPAVYDGSSDTLVATDRSGNLWALGVAARTLRYRNRFSDISGDLGSPLLLGARYLLPGRDGTVRSLGLPDGREAWSVNLDTRLVSPVIAQGRTLWIASEDGRLHHLGIEDGGRIDVSRPAGPLKVAPVGGALGRLYGVDKEGNVFACEADGTLRWSLPLPNAGWVRPLVLARELLVATERARLHALALDDGEPMWSIELTHPLQHPPVVAGDRVLCASVGRELLEIDPAKRAVTRRVPLPGRPSGPLTVLDGLVFVPMQDHGVHGYRIGDLTEQCRFAEGSTSELPAIAAGSDFIIQLADGELQVYDRELLRMK